MGYAELLEEVQEVTPWNPTVKLSLWNHASSFTSQEHSSTVAGVVVMPAAGVTLSS